MILGTKIFINFTKYPFAECIEKLQKEISNLIRENNIENVIETKITSNPINQINEKNHKPNDANIRNWTEKVFLSNNSAIKYQ